MDSSNTDPRKPGTPSLRGLLDARRGLSVLVITLAYYLLCLLGFTLSVPWAAAGSVWPAAGLATGVIVLAGWRHWPGIVLGAVLADLTAHGALQDGPSVLPSLLAALGVGVGAGLQALGGAWLIDRRLRQDPGLLRPGSASWSLFAAGPLACLVGASIGVSAAWTVGRVATDDYLFSWFGRWTGEATGVILVLPILLVTWADPRELWRPRCLKIVPFLLCTLLGLVGAQLMLATKEQARMDAEFMRDAELLHGALGKRLVLYEEAVRSVQRLYVSSDHVQRDQFRTFVSGILDREPTLLALSWNPVVSAAERPQVEHAARDDGMTGFRFTERGPSGELITARERAQYVVVLYIEPVRGNEAALGYDISSDKRRHAALIRARDDGQAVATGGITLVQEQEPQLGSLLLVPVFSGTAVPLSMAERHTRLEGYAVAAFHSDRILQSTVRDLGLSDLRISLLDTTQTPQLLARIALDDNGESGLAGPSATTPPANPMASLFNLDVAGRRWELGVRASPAYVHHRRSLQAWVALAAGLFAAGMVSAYMLVITGRSLLEQQQSRAIGRSNKALKDEVERHRATGKALEAQKERLQVTLHSIGDGVITTDPEGSVDYLNPVAERLTGWLTVDVLGKPLSDVFRIVDEITREPVSDPLADSGMHGSSSESTRLSLLLDHDGHEYSVEHTATPMLDRDGQMTGVVVVFRDVTESREMAREAAYNASHDALTGLVNRREFDKRLDAALVSSKRLGSRHALCYLDLDQFKIVNDTAGHHAGDRLLKIVAKALSGEVRDRDTLGRLGGDEFGLLLDNCPMDKAVEIAETLIAAVRSIEFSWQGKRFELGSSAGLVLVDKHAATAEELLSHADVACYAAKDAGRNRVRVYRADSGGPDPHHREMLRAADLRGAIEDDRFTLSAQPIYALGERSAAPVRYELLVRMLDENGSRIPPADFIPGAERYGLMHNIDRWVMRTTFRDHARLFPGRPDTPVAINLSGDSLNDTGLLAFLREALEHYAVDPDLVCLEITETAAIRNLSTASRFIGVARELGVRFALDDFGSGLSSFAYLKSLPVDFLKIDGSLVRNIANDDNDRAMVVAINQVAHHLGIATIAEYAETDACVAVLRSLNVDFAQGFALGRPQPLPILEDQTMPAGKD